MPTRTPRLLTAILCLALAGCATTGSGQHYIIDGQTYTSTEEALAASERAWEAKRAAVRPMARVGRSILVCSPSDETLGRPPYLQVRGGEEPDSATQAYAVASTRKMFEHNARILEKAGLFDEVSFLGTDECLYAAKKRGVEYALDFDQRRFDLVRLADLAHVNVTAPDAAVFARKVAEFAGGAARPRAAE